ncbi:MAG: prepilin-type N-terminal cleavage/methylation domain-containing protein [Gammaproteobacteria bacterium]|nr:prepilin-type N-terminal cleavage/methylation domain-containing protein [Gammaproteobacteria bacterium]
MKNKMQTNGFTLIELITVLVIIALLASIATPIVTHSITRAKESALRENLQVMRKALDDYFADQGRYPQALDELVEKRYLRHIPNDPITESKSVWQFKYYQGDDGGIEDIHSGSDKVAGDGSRYREW